MDINTAVTTMRAYVEFAELFERSESIDDYRAALADMAEQFAAIDGWLSSGGFLPAVWQR